SGVKATCALRAGEGVVVCVADEWDSDQLDLTAYLARIGDTGDAAPTGETLRRLHRRHVAAIPFENLDIPLGRGISVALSDVQTKLVGAGRGGYCYEHGLLFAAVLDRLGYGVDRLLARIGDHDARPRPRTHMALQVRAEDGEWLADVGFGAGLLEPLAWGDTGPHVQGCWRYRMEPYGESAWRVAEQRGDDWTVLYTLTNEPQHASDVLMANHFTSTHGSSPFVGLPVVMHKADDVQLRLVGRQLSRIEAHGVTAERELGDAWFARTLREDFGLRLTAAEIGKLLRVASGNSAA